MSALFGNNTNAQGETQRAYRTVSEQYPKPDTCVDTDKAIKNISDKIVSERKKLSLKLYDGLYIEALESKKREYQNLFATYGCKEIIENIKLLETGIAQTKYAIKSEQQVIPKNEIDQKIYIALGGIVLLVGLYIVINKK
jgi:hypothetical protein